ncbi:IS1595 family transposase [Gemmobacter sp.]|uniref:IS1595 family transposase n=1 Tax=Gemmobacter sp. TaxID=1898957 RepID=UPI002AFDD147|nr:IS1595 family transposase [Gemmobacter sp.]
MNKKNGLSRYRREKLLRAFVADLTASQAALFLGLSRTTVNRYYHLFRTAIATHQQTLAREALCTGTVEIDESYFGPTRPRGVTGKLKRGRGTLKQPVFGVFERGGRVFTEIVPDTNKKTLQALIRGRIALDATVVPDGWRAYDGLVDVGYDRHLRIRKARPKAFSKDGVHINGIESFWSFTKRRLAKFNGVSVNFELHLKECEWRWGKGPDTLANELKTFLV